MVLTQTLRPNASGSYNEIQYPTYGYSGKYHWEIVSNQVDEGPSYPVHDERTAYYIDTYALPNPSRLGSITNVRTYIRCQGRPYYSYFKTAIYNGSSLVYGTERGGGTGWTNYYTDYAVNPWTSQPWTWAQLDSLQAGVALKAGSSGYVECSEVWVVISSVIVGGGGQIIGLEAL